MRLPSLCGSRQTQVVPQERSQLQSPRTHTVVITATSPEEAHLFRMINTWTQCKEIEHRMELRKWR